MRSILAARCSPLLLTCAALVIMVCGCGEPRPDLRLSYVKEDSSERRMLQDKQDLLHTSGVTQALLKIDAKNEITLDLFVQDGHDNPGRSKALELGYTQIRNY